MHHPPAKPRMTHVLPLPARARAAPMRPGPAADGITEKAGEIQVSARPNLVLENVTLITAYKPLTMGTRRPNDAPRRKNPA